jgi:hypothetical protein
MLLQESLVDLAWNDPYVCPNMVKGRKFTDIEKILKKDSKQQELYYPQGAHHIVFI